jgi:hypothetical protein
MYPMLIHIYTNGLEHMLTASKAGLAWRSDQAPESKEVWSPGKCLPEILSTRELCYASPHNATLQILNPFRINHGCYYNYVGMRWAL